MVSTMTEAKAGSSRPSRRSHAALGGRVLAAGLSVSAAALLPGVMARSEHPPASIPVAAAPAAPVDVRVVVVGPVPTTAVAAVPAVPARVAAAPAAARAQATSRAS